MNHSRPRRSKAAKPDAAKPRPYTEVLTSLGTNADEFEGAVKHARELQGGTAETRFEKEFATWMVKFANAIVETEQRTKSWDRLKNAGDTRFLLFDVYRFTLSSSNSSPNWGWRFHSSPSLTGHRTIFQSRKLQRSRPRLPNGNRLSYTDAQSF